MLHTLEPSPRQLDLWADVLPRLMDRGAPVTRDPTCLDRGVDVLEDRPERRRER